MKVLEMFRKDVEMKYGDGVLQSDEAVFFYDDG